MNALTLTLAAAIFFAAAESPFVGTWKLNPAKSQFTGMTVAYEQLPSGEMRMTAEGQSYSFKTDGKEYPALFGSTATWKQIDPRTWEATNRMRDKVVSTDTLSVSPDDKTLTVRSKGTRPDGSSFEDTVAYERVSGGSALAGKWKTSKVTIGSPEIIEFAAYEGDGLSWKLPAYHASVNMKFDGEDNPVEGASVPPGLTIAVTSTGPRSFDLVEKMGGKVVYRGKYSLSEDGKSFTAVLSPEGTNEKVTVVYDRQ